jgi:hypothetical protein
MFHCRQTKVIRMSKLPTLEQIRNNVKPVDWKAELKRLKLEYIKRTAPGFYKASGGDTMHIKPWNDKTTNGLTKAIIDWLTYSGHYANRINTQGQARIHKVPRYSLISGKIEYTDKVQYTKGTTNKGTPDIDAIINGLSVKIEIKAGKDRIRDEQVTQGNRITAAGGIYFVARDMDQFVNWYRKTFNTIEEFRP